MFHACADIFDVTGIKFLKETKQIMTARWRRKNTTYTESVSSEFLSSFDSWHFIFFIPQTKGYVILKYKKDNPL